MSLVKYETKTKLGNALNTAGKIIRYAQSSEGKRTIKKVAKTAGSVARFISKGWEHMRDHFGGRPATTAGPITAPATFGVNTGGFKWSFGKAPDVGLGPGLRLFVRCRGPGLFTSSNQTTTASGFYDATNTVYRPYLMLDPSVANVTGASITYPALFQNVSGIYNMCKMFERYLIRHVTLEVAPLKSTATDGNIALGQYHDPVRADVQYSVSSQTMYDQISGLLNSCSTPIWEPYRFQALHVPDKAAISPADLLWIHTDDSPMVGADAGRLIVQGAIAVAASGAANTVQYSATMLEVCLDLYCPATVSTNVVLEDPSEKELRKFYERTIHPRRCLSYASFDKLETKVKQLEELLSSARRSEDKPTSTEDKETKGLPGGNTAPVELQPLGGKAVLVRAVDNAHTPPNTPASATQTAQSVVPRGMTRSTLW